MIKPDDLDNPERDLEMTNRDPNGSAKARAAINRVKTGTPTDGDELQALRQRIATALATTPKDPRPHCSDCFSRGWAAALKTLEE